MHALFLHLALLLILHLSEKLLTETVAVAVDLPGGAALARSRELLAGHARAFAIPFLLLMLSPRAVLTSKNIVLSALPPRLWMQARSRCPSYAINNVDKPCRLRKPYRTACRCGAAVRTACTHRSGQVLCNQCRVFPCAGHACDPLSFCGRRCRSCRC